MVTLRPSHRLPLALATGVVLIALLTGGGDVTAPPTAWVDAALILAGAAAVGRQLIDPRPGNGTAPMWLFAALVLFSGLSILWSVAPDTSWQETGRSLADLGAFCAAALLARRHPDRTAAVLSGLTLGLLGLVVWALAVKALDLNLYLQPSYGRLVGSFGYWNAAGLLGAMALPGLVWVGAEPRIAPGLRGAATAGVALATGVVVLSYSRSALLAAGLGLGVLIAGLPTRRRAVAVLALGWLGALPICADALGTQALSADAAGSIYGASGSVDRGGAALVLGGIVLLVAVALGLLGRGLALRIDTRPLSPAMRRRVDRGLLGALAAVPVAIVAWLLLNRRGPFGELSHLWSQLVSTHASVGDQGARLASIGSSRSIYWRQALAVGDHHLLAGAGAGSFWPAYLRDPTARLAAVGQAHHAHSYLFDTFAGLGLLGVALMLGLFAAWLAAARRSLRAGGRGAGPRWALLGLVVAFGASSAIDWTWSFPGVALPALLAAGWLAGLGPARDAEVVPGCRAGHRPLSTRPGAILVLTAVGAVALALAWESLAPMRSARSVSASLAAQIRGDGGAALAEARSAVDDDPVSAEAKQRLAAVLGADGDRAAARATLSLAVREQPENPQPWFNLGGYELCHGASAAATVPLRRAMMLDITNPLYRTWYSAAVARRPATLCGGGA